MKRSAWVVAVGAVAVAGCSTPAYTRAKAIEDLKAETSLSDTAIECVLDGVEARYAEEYDQLQREKGFELDDDARDVYVKNRMAASTPLDGADERAFDAIVERCTAES